MFEEYFYIILSLISISVILNLTYRCCTQGSLNKNSNLIQISIRRNIEQNRDIKLLLKEQNRDIKLLLKKRTSALPAILKKRTSALPAPVEEEATPLIEDHSYSELVHIDSNKAAENNFVDSGEATADHKEEVEEVPDANPDTGSEDNETSPEQRGSNSQLQASVDVLINKVSKIEAQLKLTEAQLKRK